LKATPRTVQDHAAITINLKIFESRNTIFDNTITKKLRTTTKIDHIRMQIFPQTYEMRNYLKQVFQPVR